MDIELEEILEKLRTAWIDESWEKVEEVIDKISIEVNREEFYKQIKEWD